MYLGNRIVRQAVIRGIMLEHIVELSGLRFGGRRQHQQCKKNYRMAYESHILNADPSLRSG